MATKLEQVFINRDEMTPEEARQRVAEMREDVDNGADPEEVLYDEGLEPDYIFDLI
jgi:hypothetical protein